MNAYQLFGIRATVFQVFSIFGAMRKYVSIGILCLFVTELTIPNMDMCEIAKIPNLIEHYLMHRSGDGLSLIDFLELHYGDEQNQQKDPFHAKLPFKDHTCATTVVFIAPQHQTINANLDDTPVKCQSFYTITFTSGITNVIFQPPRA